MPEVPGLLSAGNIDLNARPVVRNPDGSISTIRSMSVNFGNGEVLIPMISENGKPMSEEQAIRHYQKTGRHLGVFDTPDAATSYAKALSEQQAQRYARPSIDEILLRSR